VTDRIDMLKQVENLLRRVPLHESHETLPDPRRAMRLLVGCIEALAQMQPEQEHLGLCYMTPEARDELVQDMLDQCDDLAEWFTSTHGEVRSD